jgi:hypothetical protein
VTKVPVIGYPSSPVCPLVHALLRLQRRLGDRTTIDAEAVGGLTSDQSSSAIPNPSSQMCPLGRPTGRMATRRLTNRRGSLHSRQAQSAGQVTSHHIHTTHTTSPHTQREFGVESHQVEHVRFLGLGGAEYKTNTKIQSNDGNDILQKCRRKSHQRRIAPHGPFGL